MIKRRSSKTAPHSKPSKAICRKVMMLVADYLSRDLDPSTRAMFTQHIRKCRECFSFFNTYRSTIRATRNLKFNDLPADLQSRALSFVMLKLRQPSAK